MRYVDTELRGPMARIFNEHPTELVISGCSGTGKSLGIGAYIRWVCSQYRGARVLVCRQTRESLTESWMEIFENNVLLPDDPMITGSSLRRSHRHSYDDPETGSTIVMGGIDKPSKLYSTKWDIVYVNECMEIDEDSWQKFLRSLRNNKVPWQQLVGDCNPDAPTHWILKREQAGLLSHWATTHADNPAYYTSDGKLTQQGRTYIESRLGQLSGVTRERLLHGRWVAAEGLVWSEFDRSIHVVSSEPKEFRRYVASQDWGYRAPGCLHVYGIDGDGAMHLVHEIYRTRVRDEQWGEWAKDAASRWPIEAIVCDPESPASVDYYRSLGLPAVNADKARYRGIDAVRNRFHVGGNGKPGIYIWSGCNQCADPELLGAKLCTGLVSELGQYVYKRSSSGITKGDETDPRCADHACDCLRYACMYMDSSACGYAGWAADLKEDVSDSRVGDVTNDERIWKSASRIF